MANYQSSYTGAQHDQFVTRTQIVNLIQEETATLYPTKTGSGASGTWDISILGNAATATSAVYASSYLASRGTVSGSSHAAAIKAQFDANKATIPRNNLITYYSSAYSNGSQMFGYFLTGYDTTPYGGFYVCHYTSAKYVGIGGGTYTEYEISKSTSSSIRIKENIKPFSDEEGKKILQITPVLFDYKKGYGEKNQRGFIAEELENILPQAVYIPKYDPAVEEKPIQSIKYWELIPYMVKMIQIQQTEIEKLKKSLEEKNG